MSIRLLVIFSLIFGQRFVGTVGILRATAGDRAQASRQQVYGFGGRFDMPKGRLAPGSLIRRFARSFLGADRSMRNVPYENAPR